MALTTPTHTLDEILDSWKLRLGTYGHGGLLHKVGHHAEKKLTGPDKGHKNRDLAHKWKPEWHWDTQENTQRTPSRPEVVLQKDRRGHPRQADLVTEPDQGSQEWRASHQVNKAAEEAWKGVFRIGPYITAEDAEILATTWIAEQTPEGVEARTLTGGPLKALAKASTSLNDSQTIRRTV